jgi:hypothetical protein
VYTIIIDAMSYRNDKCHPDWCVITMPKKSRSDMDLYNLSPSHEGRDRTLRFANRFFQALIQFIACFMLGALNNALLTQTNTYGPKSFNIVLHSFGMIISIGLVLLHAVPFFKRKWEGKKVMIVETIADLFFFLLVLLGVITATAMMGGQCAPGTSADCDRYNWSLVFLYMAALSWGGSCVQDAVAWYQFLVPERSSRSDALLAMRQFERGRR